MSLWSLITAKGEEQMPSEWEQDVAEAYVNERRIVRPDTNIKTALISVLLFFLASSVCTWLVQYFLITIGFISYFSSNVLNFYDENPVLSTVLLCATIIIVELFFCFKFALIGTIKLYQHYAPEEIRRRCLFMPTCSEYAILAIRKYGGLIGLCKSYYRLVYLCRGNIYRIHYP